MDIRLRSLAERSEKMPGHLSGEISDVLAGKYGRPFQMSAAAEIEQHLRARFVHRQSEPIAFYSFFTAKRLRKGLSQGYPGILYRMVLIHVQIAFYLYPEGHTPVTGYLVQHMVEKTYPGRNIATRRPVQIERHQHIGLTCNTMYFRAPGSVLYHLQGTLPRTAEQHPFGHPAFRFFPAEQNTFHAHIHSQLHVGHTIAYHV